MKGRGKGLDAFLLAGLGVYALYILVNRFVLRMPHCVALPVLLAGLSCILWGAYRSRCRG